MKATRILETVLYAADLVAAERFYTSVMGLVVVSRFGDAIAFRCDEGVLLIFDPERSGSRHRSVPPHGAQGSAHIAFVADGEELADWRRHLAAHGVEIESEIEWGQARRSIYFRDPAHNLVELAPPDLWFESSPAVS